MTPQRPVGSCCRECRFENALDVATSAKCSLRLVAGSPVAFCCWAQGAGATEDRGTQVLLPVELAKTLGPLVSVLELGYNIVEKGSGEWVYGLAFSYNASKRLELLGEIHGIDDEPVFNLGTRTTLGKHFTLLASMGRGFREEPKLLGYLGLRLNF